MKDFPTSSMIASVARDDATGDLVVTFAKGGAVWAYSGVSPDAEGQFYDAPSPGQFFLTQIRGNYPERRIG